MKNRALFILVTIALVFVCFPVSSSVSVAATNSNSLLDIGYGGAFSTELGYTSATGEIMYGDVSRRTGTEQLIFGEGVSLTGGSNGIQFESPNSFGTTTLDKSLIIEAKFKPQASQNTLGTLIGVLGNMYVRYQSATTVEYGFAVNNNNVWTEYKGTVAAPEVNKEHTIAVAYAPTTTGAIMRAFLDGVELSPAVSSNGRAAISSSSNSKFGFGNEVHTSALTRGFKGSISRSVVTNFEGEFNSSMLKSMELNSVERSLMVQGLGTLKDNMYTKSTGELAVGNLEVQGGQISGLGRLSMSGNNSRITFTPNTSLLQNGVLAGDYVAEIATAPSAIKPSAILIDLAGAVKLRRTTGESVEVVVGNAVTATIDLTGKLTGDSIQMSLIYDDLGNGTAAIKLWWGQEQLGNTITLNALPSATRNSVIYAGDAAGTASVNLAGEVYGVALGKVTGDFRSNLLGLSGNPCRLPDDLEAGHQIAITANECSAALSAKASLVRPDPRQVTWQQYEQTAFLHYGINTYYDAEWGSFNEDPNMFQPTALDTDQWARSLKESGFKMAILTVKHHDGFMLYPSRYTDFSVASSTWKDGDGDVLREFVNSMRKYGIKIGVYLSPADHNQYTKGVFGNNSPRKQRAIPTLVEGDDRAGEQTLPTFNLPATDYGSFMLNQLYEVLTEYGEIDEVWFDGSQGNIPANRSETYDWDSYYSLIRDLAPNAVIAVSGNDVRWVGNESGYARENEWSVLGAKSNADGTQSYFPSYSSSDLGSEIALASAAANGMKYLTWWPAEVDVSIRPGWFYHANQSPKSVAQLKNIYYQSVARNSVLLLNIPPDKKGKLPDADVSRLKEWYQEMKRDFAVNQTVSASISSENGASGGNPNNVSDGSYDTSWVSASSAPSSLTFDLGKSVNVDKIMLQEDIRHGQQVETFAVDVLKANGEWEQIATSGVIGYKRVVLLSKVTTGQQFRIRILSSRGVVHLAEVGLYLTGSQFVDKTGLDSLVVETQMVHDNAIQGTNIGQYPTGSKQTLAAAIVAAREVSQDPNAVQTEVNAALTTLQTAFDTFVASVNDQSLLLTTLVGPKFVQAGNPFTVQLGLSNMKRNIYAQDITITYDQAAMDFGSAKSLIEGVSLVETQSSTSGNLRLIIASTGEGHAVTGNVQIVELSFVAKEVAVPLRAKVSSSDVTLADNNGVEEVASAAEMMIEVTPIAVGISGDINNDGRVSIGDLAIVAANYGKDSTSPDWAKIKHADINKDGIIDLTDLAAVASKIVE
ncbi:alpha-L-fucosidase [Paenibacillus antarcticus]|uniref:alpha-L-fucosidase n=1 Tax=Paenibacillus antarcticus TaxID=253703 RepID=UPI000839A979|nr:alpha-L-fucosidase [Paenibacillus antarcticus]